MTRALSGEVVARYVRGLIFDGTLRPGERLQQDQIASALGVSRIPVREAIMALDSEGWVTLNPRRGAYVLGLDRRYVLDHYRLLAELFGMAARRATERLSGADAAALAEAADRLPAAATVEAFSAASDEFVALMLSVADSPRLTSVLRLFPGIVPGDFFAQVGGARDVQEHGVRAVTDEILTGSALSAGAAMKETVLRQGELVSTLLEERGVLGQHSEQGPWNGRAQAGDRAGAEPAQRTRQTRSSAFEAGQYIKAMIFDGRLRGGERVPQDDIAAALDISRVPIREALFALEREGWVTLEMNRGAFAIPISASSVADHYAIPGVVYGTAAQMAVERDEKRDLRGRLNDIAAGFNDPGDLEMVASTAIAFHGAVVQASQSDRVRAVLRSIRPFVPGNFYQQVPGAVTLERRSTTVIRRAIQRRDGDAAEAEYHSMLDEVGRMVVQLLVDRDVIESSQA
jgi:DNA-binding GntR family transcriptional regulator